MNHPHADEVTLPLRLAAEPYARLSLSSSSVALSVHKELAILVDDRGVIALASETVLTRSDLLPLLPPEVQSHFSSSSILILIRDSPTGNTCQWHCLAKSQAKPHKIDDKIVQNHIQNIPNNSGTAQWITTAIRKYYAQQILEPSVRGFLSVLEKQFSQSNLYIFELLQNAVDDGATHVTFQATNNSLVMTHNGRQFTPLDVLGMSSVGLSTKSRQGKRTVGFMGVGFKAVYKRYAKVTIDDGQYAFSYQEPPNNQQGYGWVMLPLWQTPRHVESQGCRFSLEQPRGGFSAVLKDLAVLPRTAPPLLGRAALLKQESTDTKEWTLDWNGTVHKVQRTQLQQYNSTDSSEVVTVKITKPDGSTRTSAWLFVTHEYTPNKEAQESYHRHTKRTCTKTEQVCGFIPLSSATSIASNFSGVIHSVLPTKIKLPIPLHLQGPFLLSVDRQQVQDLSDNAWNLNILLQLPQVIAIVLRWAARKGVTDYTGISKLLPMPTDSSCSSTQLLNQTISLQPLQQVLYNDPTLPVALPRVKTEETSDEKDTQTDNPILTGYYEGSNSVWVPPAFHTLLAPDFLRGWLGKRPLRTDAFGKDGAYHPLFLQTTGQIETVLPHRLRQLGEELQLPKRGVTVSAIKQILRAMAAIGIATKEANSLETKKDTSTASNATTITGPRLPLKSNVWPLFLNEEGGLSTIDQIIVHAEDVTAAPPDLIPLLRPYFVEPEKMDTGSGRGGRAQKKRKLNQRKVLRKLHPQLESTICDIEAGRAPKDVSFGTIQDKMATGITSFLEQVRLENPTQVVSVGTAVSRLLESYSMLNSVSDDHIGTVLKITKFSIETNNHHSFSFVLVDSKGTTKVVGASKAYMGKLFDEAGLGADLESFAGKRLDFLSSAYANVLKTKSLQRKFVDLVTLAGVQTGPAVIVSALIDVEKEKTLLAEEILPTLSGCKLPQLRNKQPKCELKLPYDLGVVMTRKKLSLLDSELAFEWEELVEQMTAECAKGFISLLLAMPVEGAIEITHKSVPAAAACLQGQESNQNVSVTPEVVGNRCSTRIPWIVAVPLRRRLYFLPPGQPGAKALDISEARFIKQLKALKWLPCTLPSDPDSGVMLLRPEETLLEEDRNQPDMPVVSLPPTLKRRLQESEIAKFLTFGTKAPPPPVDELERLAMEAGTLLTSSNVESARVSSLSNKMILLWTSITRSHLRDGLSSSDMKKLRLLSENAYCIPARRILGATTESNWIVRRERCVRIVDPIGGQKTNGEKEDLSYLSVASLVASDFMCDFHHSRHNPFFSNPSISAEVQKLCGIPEIGKMHTSSLVRVCSDFIQYCCTAEPLVPNRASPLREAFSFAMKYCISSPTVISKLQGNLKVWVRSGPGVGSKALRRGWVSPNDKKVRAVLDDSRVRSALLSPDMGIQLLGVLNHTENERDCPHSKILSKIDDEVIQHLGIWRLSDKRFTVKTRAKGQGKLVGSASSRLQLVCALLKSMMMMEQNYYGEAGHDSSSIGNNGFLAATYEPPLMIRHESLSREFKGPGMDKPSLTPMFAVIGRAPNFTKDRCILVAGDPDDYSMELEEVILGYVGTKEGGSFNTSKRWRAAVRLLSHLENESSFEKFMTRDFGEDDVARAWRKLVERRCVLEKLEKAASSKDLSLLRDVIEVAEELCKDDPDGGVGALGCAKDLLQDLKAEEDAERNKERKRALEELKVAMQQNDHNKLRISILLAQKVCTDDSTAIDLLNEAKDRLRAIEQEANKSERKMLIKEEPMTTAMDASVSASVSAEVSGTGRGRGRTLPAWMTSAEGPRVEPRETKPVKQEEEEPSPTMSDTPTIPVPPDSGRGRGLGRTLPAWMTSGDGPRPADKPPKEENGKIGSHEEPSNDTLAAAVFDNQAAGLGLGRGRGKTLPAWLTSKSNSKPDFGLPDFDQSEEAPRPLGAALSADASVTTGDGMGRGRGRTLPAWMTSGDGPKPASNETATTVGAQAESADIDAKAQARSILSGILSSEDTASQNLIGSTNEINDGPPEVGPTVNERTFIASGGGRGVSKTLPAWMTNANGNGPKRVRPEPGEASDVRKKARTEVEFEYSIRIQMDPFKEPDFAKWLESAVQKEASARGGSASFQQTSQHEPSQFED